MNTQKLTSSELPRLSVDEFKKSSKNSIVVVLDNIRSLNNIGSIFRTCDAFLIEKIYLCGITAIPPHKDIQKTALGATETVDWEYQKDTLSIIEKLNSNSITIAVEQTKNSTILSEFSLTKNKKVALVFGNEVYGVSQEVINVCQRVVEIPQFGTKHSLNVAISAGVMIWDIFIKMKKEASF